MWCFVSQLLILSSMLPALKTTDGPSVTKVQISFTEPALAGMPIWLMVETPNARKIHYTISTAPSYFGCNTVEVQQEGRMSSPLIQPDPAGLSGATCGFVSAPGSPESRLPIHLQYPSLAAGTYLVRYSRYEFMPQTISKEVTEQSDWTPLVVRETSQTERAHWSTERLAHLPQEPGLLVGDALPSLLEVPSRELLRVVLESTYSPNDVLSRYAANSLPMFDRKQVQDELLSCLARKGPNDKLAWTFAGQGDMLLPIAEQIVALVLPHLHSSDPVQVESAIQLFYLSRNPYYRLSSTTLERIDTELAASADHIIGLKNEHAAHHLAQYLGAAKPPGARNLLWKLVNLHLAYEQGLICITWLGDSRDLALVVAEMEKEDASDPMGRQYQSLAGALVRGYGPAEA